ncbi:alanine:cation symporter family protein [Vibrio sinaloensis]|nr:alanine:cation symporter family protein [Vibrio sinaloensis]
MVMFGAVASLPVVWALADVSMGLMAIVNLVAIILLSGIVIKLAKDYNRQLSEGKVPTFDSNDFPELKSQLEEGIWDQKQERLIARYKLCLLKRLLKPCRQCMAFFVL